MWTRTRHPCAWSGIPDRALWSDYPPPHAVHLGFPIHQTTKHRCVIQPVPRLFSNKHLRELCHTLPAVLQQHSFPLDTFCPQISPACLDLLWARTGAQLSGWRAFLSPTPNPSHARSSPPGEPWRNTRENQVREFAGE